MSKAAQNTRRIFTGVDSSGAVPIEYRFSHARNGNRHLVVVFANFTAPGEYGWSNGVLDKVRSNILWIRDLFDGANTYYLCKGMDFSLEQSVAGLIHRVMGALSLSPDEVTMFGSSKGGSAALFFGLKYGFRNIVASVPQFLIGTYVTDGIPGAAKVMMGEVTEHNVRTLDSVLPDLVRSGANPAANIYVITSPQDEQYQRQVEPSSGCSRGGRTSTSSTTTLLITDHGKVTLRNLPTIMGLLNLLVDGITPRIGMVRNGHEQPERDASAIDAFLTQTSQVRADESFPKPVVLTPAPEERVPANTVRFTGTAAGAVRVSFWQDGKYQGAAPVAADGSWVWERTSLGQGQTRHQAVRGGREQLPDRAHRSGVHRGGARLRAAARVRAGTSAAAPSGPAPRADGVRPGRPPAGARPRRRLRRLRPRRRPRGLPGGRSRPGNVRGACRRELGVGAGWAWNEGDHFVEAIAVDAVGNASPWTAVPFSLTRSAYGVPAQGGYFSPRY